MMPSILNQGYGPILGYMQDTGSLLGGSSPAKFPSRPPIPQAQLHAPNYQGSAAGYRQLQQQQDAQNAQTATGAASLAYLAYLGYLACWVAREVYGVEDPKWMVFREWLLNRAPAWFRDLYLRHGERFAGFLRRHPWLKPPIRRWMDGKIATA